MFIGHDEKCIKPSVAPEEAACSCIVGNIGCFVALIRSLFFINVVQ